MANTENVLFELPYSVESPTLINRDLGLSRIVLRRDRHSYIMSLTVFDTPDARLTRSGVLLARRTNGATVEWALKAPNWAPFLPKQGVRPATDSNEMPAEYQDFVRPFRRHSGLEPMATARIVRNEYLFLGESDERLGKIRDEKVSIKRGDQLIAKYREVILYPEDGLDPRQVAFLTAQLEAAGARQVAKFPSFTDRLGKPFSGDTDFQDRGEVNDEMNVEEFISWAFSQRLTNLVRADLAVRSGAASDISEVLLQLAGVRDDLDAFAGLVDREWCDTFRSMITPMTELGPGPLGIEDLGEGYSTILEELVGAARHPRVGDLGQEPAKVVLAEQVAKSAGELLEAGRTLRPSSIDRRWMGLSQLLDQVMALVKTSEPLFGDTYNSLCRRLRKLKRKLRRTLQQSMEPDEDEIRELSPLAAYQFGRTYQAKKDEIRIGRTDFVEEWPKVEQRLAKLLKK